MKKKQIIWISSISAIVCIISICLLCFFCIPRIEYTYDAQNESYIVDKVYGNAKSYTIEAYIDLATLKEGEHVLDIYSMASGMRFDRFYLTKGSELPPVDTKWRAE